MDNNLKIVGPAMPDMPWEDRPAGSKEVMWRYSANPIIPRDALSTSNSIFNSAVIPFKKGKYNYAGVFRCDDTNRRMRIHAAFSVDGIKWDICEEDFKLVGADPEIAEWVYGYDPRVAKIEDKYYVTWCNGYHGPTIGIAWTDDFETFHQLENAFIPFNRNGVLFPRKINGRFAMLSRPSDNGHTAFGDIFYSESPDMEFWGRHRHVMSPAAFEVSAWQCMKIGAGPVPIETSEGWLLLYHGVLRSCNGYVYAFGSALLDLDQPWKTIARSGPYLISPREIYELTGDVPNVTFPCASLHDPETAGSPSITDAPTPSRALPSVISPKSSSSPRKTIFSDDAATNALNCCARRSRFLRTAACAGTCRLGRSFRRHDQLRHDQPRRSVSQRHDVRGAFQRDGFRRERLRQGRPLVVHAL